MNTFLRENKFASYILTVIRIYIGYQWLTAGYKKITGGFEANGFIMGAIQQASGERPTVQGWWASFLENVALPNIDLFNVLVPWGEFLVGLGLILGCLTIPAVFFGMMMNFSFIFSGTVSSNALMILLSIFVIVSGKNAGRIGLDHFVLPYIKTQYNNIKNNVTKKQQSA